MHREKNAEDKTILIALGGNALLRPDQEATYENQLANVAASARLLAKLAAKGYRLAITHGNGPQIGNILRQNEEASAVVPPLPLDVCLSESQGLIGYMIQQSLNSALHQMGLDRQAVCILTRVEVAGDDPAFGDPAKPIGPAYRAEAANQLMAAKKWMMKLDAGRGWRRVVPSPKPRRILETQAVASLLKDGFIPIACGGGGIPVVKGKGGIYEGIEAVVDKDLSSAKLAQEIEADLLVIATDVENVYLDFGRPGQRPLGEIAVAELKEYIRQGQFTRGSMGPKIEAAVQFAENMGQPAIICALDRIDAAIEGRSGTRVSSSRRKTA